MTRRTFHPSKRAAVRSTYPSYAGQQYEQNRETKVNDMNLIQSYGIWRLNRETARELSRLSTRELNDLGISRSSIIFGRKKSV